MARLTAIGTDTARDDAAKAFNRINTMLAQDNAKGALSRYTGNQRVGTKILHFAGVEREVDYGVIKQLGDIEGMPVAILGRDNSKHIQLRDGDQVLARISLSEDLAIKIMDAQCVFRKYIRLTGEGDWLREGGEWKLSKFRAYHFSILDKPLLVDSVASARGTNEKMTVDDPLKLLQQPSDIVARSASNVCIRRFFSRRRYQDFQCETTG